MAEQRPLFSLGINTKTRNCKHKYNYISNCGDEPHQRVFLILIDTKERRETYLENRVYDE